MNSQDSHNKQDTWEEERKRLRDKLPSNHKYSVISFYVVATVIVIFILTKIGNNLDKIALTFGAGMCWLWGFLIPWPLDLLWHTCLLRSYISFSAISAACLCTGRREGQGLGLQ